MTRKLTETAVSRAPVPTTGQTMIWDTGRGSVTGFAVRILPGGSRTFWYQYRSPGGRSGTNRMVRIGAFPTITLAAARKRARDLAGQAARGLDPAAERAEARRRNSSTLRALLAVEGGPYQRDLERRGIVARKVILSGLNRGLARLMSKDVAALTRRDFVSAISAIEAAGKPGAAQDLRKFARTFLEWCVSTGRAHSNVLAGLRQPKRSRVERLKAASNGGRALSDDEIHKVWQAAGDNRFGGFGGLVRLALLTGLRRGELAQIERARDLLADRIVVQPEHAKTGAQHEVPLTDLMREVIAGSPATTSKLLFPSTVTGGRIKGWTKLVAKLQQASGVDFRLHDLRRTARTLISRLGVAEDIAELAIGHVRADLVARYNKDTAWEGRRDAFTRVSDHVATLISARPGAARPSSSDQDRARGRAVR
jgi:integrase